MTAAEERRAAELRAEGRRRAERGSATVLTGAALGAVVVVLSGVLVLAGVVRDVHRARGAADLAALAAAVPLVDGAGVDCAAAASVATANGAAVTACVAEPDGSVVVSVSVSAGRAPPVAWALPAAVTARSRAGLADLPP